MRDPCCVRASDGDADGDGEGERRERDGEKGGTVSFVQVALENHCYELNYKSNIQVYP
jgi:hypothetical protein